MLKPTSQILLHGGTKNDNKNIDTLNTIKIDFSSMSRAPISKELYTDCKQCGALLTKEDSQGEVQKKNNELIWFCQFCKKENVCSEIHFAENGAKFVLEHKMERDILPPILLFLIDQSGSMSESISVDLEGGGTEQKLITLSKEIGEIIKKSFFYKKQVHKEEELKEIYQFESQKQNYKQGKMQGRQYYSKITFFMAIIEDYLNNINTQIFHQEFRIGFIFFNEAICIMKPSKQKFIPVIMPVGYHFLKQYPFEKQQVNFKDYEALFNEGRKYDRFFGDCRLKKMDLSKLPVEHIDAKGQTALGPALVFALGIASVHDIGSRIILVSDSMPNMGILADQNLNVNTLEYQKIQSFLVSHKLTISIMNWIEDSYQSPNSKKHNLDLQDKLKQQFRNFVVSDTERIKEITLDFSVGLNHVIILEKARKTMKTLLNRGSIGEALKIQIYCSNENIMLKKFKYDTLDYRFIKFLGVKSKNFIELTTDKIKNQIDYLFPVVTQAVVIYDDVYTKQRYLFVSYVKQKLLKSHSPKQTFEYLENSNIKQLQELFDLQKIKDFNKDAIIPENLASHIDKMKTIDIQKIRQVEVNFSKCQSLNDLVDIENRNSEGEDNCF